MIKTNQVKKALTRERILSELSRLATSKGIKAASKQSMRYHPHETDLLRSK